MAVKNLYPSFQNPYLIKPTRPIPKEMAVVGSGTIGPDIAYGFRVAFPDMKLFLVDVVEEPLNKAKARFDGYAKKGLERKTIKPEQVDKILGNIVYTTDYSQLKNCELVIEAATENLDLKKKILSQIESIVAKDTIITSNTSGILAHQIFSHLNNPERTTNTHFFEPAWRSMGVEVINWEKANPETVNWLLWFFAQAGKAPIAAQDAFSFVLNRLFETWGSETAWMLPKATSKEIDYISEEFLGAGPFGIMTNPLTYSSMMRRTAEGACYTPSRLLLSVEKWAANKPRTKVDVDPELAEWIRMRFLGCVFSQAFDIADRNIGTSSDLNFGSMIALGYKKGIFDLMASLGVEKVKAYTAKFDAERPGFPKPAKPIQEYLDFPRDILVDKKDGVVILTQRRPQAANALSDKTCNEILAELKKGEADPSIKGFVITGYGPKAFCAGADIGGFVATFGNHEKGQALSRGNSKVLEYIDKMNKPVVAALNGLAMGGGTELAIRCHSMVAMEKAFMQLPEITLGMIPGMGGVVIPYRKWPKAAAKFHAMISQSERLTVQEAAEIGIVKKIVKTFPELIDAAIAEVNALQGNIPRVPDGPVDIPEYKIPDAPMAGELPLSKEILGIVFGIVHKAAKAKTLAEALEIAYVGAGDISCAPDCKEGVSAFLEKRKPNFAK
ncbi:MAG: 3-hydroxyacyl-CoA dehydrogenase/enoyl-CoA hydratase family protein [Acidobacteriota bacterium]|jgi:3-hydroxyacyl-CoA dehydrogenase/enoyl-CoA hydratase/carnithine racemase|nr:3-hydroxyacyl-CoA dehydrogenase/enoyl-CoA hydratase family protein [Acidobacteriota bacterium]